MTEDTARRIATLVLGAAALGVAYYVLRTPPLRRAVWRLAVSAATTTLPAWFARELERAWTESGTHAL